MPLSILTSLVLAVLFAADPLAHWPQFRGVNGSGVGASGSYPVNLDERSRAWSAEVPFGRSSPVVYGDRVIVTVRVRRCP